MRIDPKATLAGHPILEIQKLLKHHADALYREKVGRAFAMANAGPPITRARAESLLRQFLARVRKVNEDRRFLIRVVEVRVFGSYAAGAATLGDVDLAVRYERKDPDEYSELAEEQVRNAKRAGHYFSTYFEEISWPEDRVREFLRGTSGFLSLHDLRVEKTGPVAEAKVVLYSGRPAGAKRNRSEPARTGRKKS